MAEFGVRYINSPGLVSKGIDFVTFSLLDHAELITPEGSYIGAHAGTGIQERAANYCTPTYELRYMLTCTDKQLVNIMRDARKDIGVKYDYENIFGIMFRNRKLHSTTREICSEWVTQKTMDNAIYMLNVKRAYTNLVTPEMLHLSPLHLPEYGGRCTYIGGVGGS